MSTEPLSAALSRRKMLSLLAGSAAVGLDGLAGPKTKTPPFNIRTTQETGWNIFRRKAYSTNPKDISVNYPYLENLREAGLNWQIVFWTNGPEFNEAWADASAYAHSHGLRLARAVYGFCGGAPEIEMTEPRAPAHLLRPSARGTKTALCPHDPETREWVAKALEERVKPDVDGIVIEPARETSQNCICSQCKALRPFQWDVLIVNFMSEHLLNLKSDLEIMLHLNATETDASAKRAMAADLNALRGSIRYIFGWGTDDEALLIDWLDADPRFQAFTKLSRVILFPHGTVPQQRIEQRTAKLFTWCRLAADRGKKAYSYDWRLFAGTEWEGHEKDNPTTRLCQRIPASLALMGAAMNDPYLDEKGQETLLRTLRAKAEWDLDDPASLYRGS